jgi:polysaccharide export outer membrane protein
MTGEYLVERDGNIAVPLAGRVPVANLTPPDAEKAVRDKLRNGLVVDPQVTVDVVQFRPIYVVGEVTHPGAYDYISNINVINAVALAGGFTYRAKKDAITLMRGAAPDQKKYTVSDTTALLPGDVITVPERFF